MLIKNFLLDSNYLMVKLCRCMRSFVLQSQVLMWLMVCCANCDCSISGMGTKLKLIQDILVDT